MSISKEERQALIESLIGWVDSERSVFLSKMREAGTPLKKKVRRVFGTRAFVFTKQGDKKRGTWSLDKTGEDEIEVSTFSRRHKWLPLRWKGSEPSPIAPSKPQPPSETEAAGVVVKETDDWFAESILAEYISTLPDVTEPDLALATRVVSEHLDYLFGDSVPVAEELQCGGILPEGDVVTVPGHGIELRRLNSEELGSLVDTFFGGSGDESLLLDTMQAFIQNMTTPPPELAVASALTLRRDTPKADAINGPLHMARLVLAIQLLGFTISGRGIVRKWVERGPNRGNLPAAIVVPEMPEFEERVISADQLACAYELSRRIPIGFSDPHGREEVALHHFALGASQMSNSEAVISFTIALEALFVPGLQGEASYRFRLNGSKFLGSNLVERRDIYNDLKAIYQVRSRLVHGTPPSSEEVRRAKQKARTLTATALVKAVTEGWPTVTDYEDAALM